jgi:phosphate:Na+ symporter
MLHNPSLAISETIEVLNTMGELAHTNVRLAYRCFLSYDYAITKQIRANENEINLYDKGITNFLVKIVPSSITKKESELIYRLHQVNHNFERIGDHADHLTSIAEMKYRDNISFSKDAQREIEEIYNKVDEILVLALKSLQEKNPYIAAGAKQIENSIDVLQRHATESHIDRLNQSLCSADLRRITILESYLIWSGIGDLCAIKSHNSCNTIYNFGAMICTI